MKKKTGDDYLFEIACFLVTSADRTLGPERNYGACRLVQTMYMLSFLPDYTEMKGNELLMKVRAYVDSGEIAMDKNVFIRKADPLRRKFMLHLFRQNQLLMNDCQCPTCLL